MKDGKLCSAAVGTVPRAGRGTENLSLERRQQGPTFERLLCQAKEVWISFIYKTLR